MRTRHNAHSAHDRTSVSSSGTDFATISDNTYERMRRLVTLLMPRIPAAAVVGPRFDERLASLHPRILQAAAQLYLDGHEGSAIFEAFKAVETRVKQLVGQAGQGKDGKGLMGHVALHIKSPLHKK